MNKKERKLLKDIEMLKQMTDAYKYAAEWLGIEYLDLYKKYRKRYYKKVIELSLINKP